MFASHPFQRWPRDHRRVALICISVIAFLPVFLGPAVKPLHEDKPGGESIVAFEFAGSVDRAAEIKETWRAEGVSATRRRSSSSTSSIRSSTRRRSPGCASRRRVRGERLGKASFSALGIAMAWVAFLAAGFDYVENLGLDISLWGDPASPWPQLSAVAATLKFAAIALCLLYALSGAVAALIASRRRAARPA